MRSRELHVVPGERHVQRRGDEKSDALLLPERRRARGQTSAAMKQSVSSGMCGPCCSVVPIGIRTASTPCSIRSSTSGQVIRSMKFSLRPRRV